MNKTYEFGYQTRKQKAVLWSCKLFFGLLTASSVHTLGWSDQSSEEKLGTAGSIFVGFWIYSNLCRVKIEVQEIFVPPYDNMHMIEAMIIGGVLMMFDTVLVVYDIGRLQLWWS